MNIVVERRQKIRPFLLFKAKIYLPGQTLSNMCIFLKGNFKILSILTTFGASTKNKLEVGISASQDVCREQRQKRNPLFTKAAKSCFPRGQNLSRFTFF